MAGKFCSKCGKEIIPGKRFCGGCGQAIPVPVSSSCLQCGAPLLPGKRFCKTCGHAVEAPPQEALVNVATTPLTPDPDQDPVAAPPAAEVTSPAPSAPETTTEAAAIRLSNEVVEPAPVSRWAQGEDNSPAPETVSPAPFVPPALPNQPRQNLPLIIGIAAVVLIVILSGSALYFTHHRKAALVAAQPTGTQQATEEPLVPGRGAGAVTFLEQQAKSSAATPAASTPAAPSPHLETASLSKEPSPQKAASQPASPLPVPAPRTQALLSAPSASAAPRSGVLHYSGPAVPLGGEVVFDHLPQARLKFKFDRETWQLTIKPNPDGSKKVTLTSQKPGFQANCELGWELAE